MNTLKKKKKLDKTQLNMSAHDLDKKKGFSPFFLFSFLTLFLSLDTLFFTQDGSSSFSLLNAKQWLTSLSLLLPDLPTPKLKSFLSYLLTEDSLLSPLKLQLFFLSFNHLPANPFSFQTVGSYSQLVSVLKCASSGEKKWLIGHAGWRILQAVEA